MMTQEEIKTELRALTANYGADFYKDTNDADVLLVWSVQFANDNPGEVREAVQNCISTLSFKPKVADIRLRMALNRMGGQMTATEAFQKIYKAVRKSYDKESATTAYNELQPILRKVVGEPAILVSWHRVSDEAFQTVIMSAIRESYRELAKQELEYYMLPNPLQQAEKWRVEAPEQVALPEPEVVKSVQQVLEEADRKCAEHGMTMTDELRQKHSDRVNAFIQPVTPQELKMFEAKKRHQEKLRLERMRNDG